MRLKSSSADSGPLAALLTPWGQGGIAVIELIGRDAVSLLASLSHPDFQDRVRQLRPHRLGYARLVQDGDPLDEVVVELAEAKPLQRLLINCHGGLVSARRLLDALAARGARAVSAGDLLALHRRVGTLDAVQCEAARLIPSAPTLLAVRALTTQYLGALATARHDIGERIERGAHDRAAEALEALLATAPWGRALSNPPRIVVAGRPNVGKSTLINALLRYDRVIVHAEPGTTRDAVEDRLAIEGVPFRIMDTAGIRDAAGSVEQAGVARGRYELAHADLAVLLFDGSEPMTPEDDLVLAAPRSARTLVAVNKCDRPMQLDLAALAGRAPSDPIRISAATETGLSELERRILDAMWPHRPDADAPILFTDRQERLAREALRALAEQNADAACACLERILND